MAEITETVVFLVCEKCGNKWLKRFGRMPKCCANKKCRSPNWNRSAREPKPAA